MEDLSTYINYRPIYDLYLEIKSHMDEGQQYKDFYVADHSDKEMFEFTNIHDTFKGFDRKDLFNRESMLYKLMECDKNKVNRRGKTRYGMIFTVMLPKEFNNKTYIQKLKIKDELIKILVPDNSKLIHIGYSVQYGNGLYFKVLMLDRELYPNGLEVDDVATNDMYKRLYTHQLMSKEEYYKDISKGYIAIKKGDIRGTKIIFKSSKYRAYALSKTKFKQKMEELRLSITEMLLKYIYKLKEYKTHIKKVALQHYDKRIKKTIRLTYYNHNKFLWYEYRKKTAVNSLVTAVNIAFNKVLQGSVASDTMPEIYEKIYKRVNALKHTRVKNIDNFELSIKNEIQEYTKLIHDHNKKESLYDFAIKMFGEKLQIVEKWPIF